MRSAPAVTGNKVSPDLVEPGMTNETLPATAREKNLRLFRIASDRAEKKIGTEVFLFLQASLRKALIAQEILVLINEQDEDTSDARVREMVEVLMAILEMSV
jgi:hypothetical protein